MKKTHMTLLTAGLLASSVAMAEFSANVAMTTNYSWRGVSQSDNDPAIQGGFDYSHASGFSAGVWASNVDFDEAATDPADMEFDAYASFGGEFSNGLGWSVGVIRYIYPGSSADLDWTEFNAGLSYKWISASVNHSTDVFASSNDGTYYNLGASFELPQKVNLALSVGKYSFDSAVGKNDYVDYKVGVSKEIGGFGFDLSYKDTDLSKSECQSDYATTNDWCDGALMLTVSKSL